MEVVYFEYWEVESIKMPISWSSSSRIVVQLSIWNIKDSMLAFAFEKVHTGYSPVAATIFELRA